MHHRAILQPQSSPTVAPTLGLWAASRLSGGCRDRWAQATAASSSPGMACLRYDVLPLAWPAYARDRVWQGAAHGPGAAHHSCLVLGWDRAVPVTWCGTGWGWLACCTRPAAPALLHLPCCTRSAAPAMLKASSKHDHRAYSPVMPCHALVMIMIMPWLCPVMPWSCPCHALVDLVPDRGSRTVALGARSDCAARADEAGHGGAWRGGAGRGMGGSR